MRGRFVLTPVVIACAIALVSAAPAQDASKRLQPTGVATAASTLRTPEQMDAFEAVNVAPTPRAEHFEPTMDIDTYRSLKQQAKLAPRPTKDAPRSGPLAPPVTGSMFPALLVCWHGRVLVSARRRSLLWHRWPDHSSAQQHVFRVQQLRLPVDAEVLEFVFRLFHPTLLRSTRVV